MLLWYCSRSGFGGYRVVPATSFDLVKTVESLLNLWHIALMRLYTWGRHVTVSFLLLGIVSGLLVDLCWFLVFVMGLNEFVFVM